MYSLQTNFLPPHAVSLNFERVRGRRTSVAPYVYHLVLLMLLIIIIGAVRHWVEVSGVVSGVMGSVIAVYVITVFALPHLYGPLFMSAEEVAGPVEEVVALLDNERSSATVESSGGDNTSLHSPDAEGEHFVSFFGREVPLSEVIWSWRSYAMMTFFMCVSGSGLLVINNIQAVAQAVKEDPSPFFVTVLSLANACGRVCIGLLADHSPYSRFQLQIVICLLMALAQFVLSLASPIALYPCLLTVGIMFGCTFSNVSASIADVFGSKHIGANYGYIDLAPIFGSYIFSVGLIAAFYPKGNCDDDGDDDDADCVGAHCFRYSFYVTTTACLIAAALSYLLHIYTPMNKHKLGPVKMELDDSSRS